VRTLVLAALAAWVILLPSVVHAQWRVEGQGRPNPQIQRPFPDVRRGGGFARMLRDIAGARLDRAHADRRSDGPRGGDRKDRRR
jgi:hypothetical protein